MKKNYFPQDNHRLAEWLNDFSIELFQSGTQLGIMPAEIAVLNELINSVIKDMSRSYSEETEIKKEAMLFYLSNMIDKMKRHPAFEVSNFCKKMGIN